MKKVLAVFLTICLIVGIVPFGTFTFTTKTKAQTVRDENIYIYNIVGGEAEITGANTTLSGDVVLPDYLEGCPVTSIAQYAFYGYKEVTSVTVGDNCEKIGQSAFWNFEALESITFGASVVDVADGIFTNCITDCYNLKEINISPDNTAFSSIDGVLFNEEQTTLIRYPSKKTGSHYTIPDSVTYIEMQAFYSCDNLESITFGSSVKKLGYWAFDNCYNLRRVILPTSIKSIYSSAFANCSNISDVYYEGTEEDKENITIEDNNEYLLNATWHYNTCPAGEHSYLGESDSTCENCEFIRFIEVTSLSFDDITVYDGMQSSDGKFSLNNYGIIYFDNGFSHSSNDFYTNNTFSYEGYEYTVEFDDNQDASPWQVGGSYVVTATVNGVSDTFIVQVRPNPFTAFDIEDGYEVDPTIYSSVKVGDKYKIGNEYHGASFVTFRGIKLSYPMGDTSESTGGVWLEGANTVWPEIYCDVPTSEWVKGETYELTATLLGFTDTFNITYTEISDVIIEDVEKIVNCGGNWQEFYKPDGTTEQWFYYDIYPKSITVSFKNGFSLSDEYSIVARKTGLNIDFISDQSFGNQWGIGEHAVTVKLYNPYHYSMENSYFTENYTVKVVESPVESITISPVTIVENTNGYENNGYWYYWVSVNDKITIKFKDETSFIGSPHELYDRYGENFYLENDQSADNPWYLGEHKAIFSFMGFEAEFSVIIKPYPIVSLDVTDMSFTEFTRGYYEGDKFIYGSFMPEFEVTLDDERVIKSNGSSGVEIDGMWYPLETNLYELQTEAPWEAGNTYEVTANLGEVTDTFNITINAMPIASLSVDDIEIVEYSSGEYLGEDFFYYRVEPYFSVTLTNGEIIYGGLGSIWIDGESYFLSVDASSQYDEPWVAGNTYQATATIGGVTDTFNVTIKETPIQNIEVSDITIIENTHGFNYGYQFEYTEIYPEITATLKNGKTVKNDAQQLYIENHSFFIQVNLEGQYLTPWIAGNSYEATVTVAGMTKTFNISIIENPIVELTVADREIYEGFGGTVVSDGEDEYIEYDINTLYYRLPFSVKLKDGSVIESVEKFIPGMMGPWGVYIEGEFYDATFGFNYEVADDQDEEPWGVGTHTAFVKFMGVTDEINVIIKKSPIESIEIEDITLYEDVDAYEYYLSPKFTATLTGGRNIEGRVGEDFFIDEEYLGIVSIDEEERMDIVFEAGRSYELVAGIGLISDTFTLTIEECPVESIEITKLPKTEYLEGEVLDLRGLEYRVHYTEGGYEDFVQTQYFNPYMPGVIYSEKLGRELYLELYEGYGEYLTAEDEAITLCVSGKTASFDITVNENLVESITLREDSDKSLYFTFNCGNNPSSEMKILYIEINDGGDDFLHGNVYTDKGIFGNFGFIRDKQNNTLTIRLGDDTDNITSNTISGGEYVDAIEAFIFNGELLNSNLTEFTGDITEENIDALIESVTPYDSFLWEDEDNIAGYWDGSFWYKGDAIREKLSERYAFDDIDLSLSSRYDAEADAIRHIYSENWLYTIHPFEVSIFGDFWKFKLSYKTDFESQYEGDVAYILLDASDYKIAGISLNGTIPYPKTVTEISIESAPENFEYLEGVGELNLDGATIRVNYDYYDDAVIDITDEMVSGFDNTVVGKQAITVTYKGKTTTFDIRIVAKSITGIEIASAPNKLNYFKGKEALSVEGGRIRINYNNGTFEEKDMSLEMVSGFDNSVSGTQTLQVAYKDYTATFEVEVVEVVVTTISVSQQPTKLKFIEGKEQLDITGGKLYVTYNDNSFKTIDITLDMISGFDNTVVGDQTLTVTYGGKSATYIVEIIAKSPVNIEIDKLPTKLEYLEFKDTLDVTGGKIKLNYNNDTYDIIDITPDMISGFDNTTLGKQVLTVTYNGYITAFDIEIVSKLLVSIEIESLPEKLTYLEAKDNLDVANGKLKLNYNNDTNEVIDITPDMILGFDNTKVGEQNLTVTYKGKTATYKVEIIAKSLVSIEIENLPEKLTYLEVKDTLDVTNGTIKLNYNNDTDEVINITPDMISGFDNTTVGKQNLTVTYKGKTATYEVEIIAKSLVSIEIENLPEKLTYLEGKDALDVTNGKIKLNYDNDTNEVIDITADMISGFKNNRVGKQTLTVTYKGKTATYEVEIVAKSLVSIEIYNRPQKLSYLEAKDTLNTTNGLLKLNYNNGTNKVIDITVDMISGFDNTRVGKQTLTVTYEGKTATYEIEIIAKSLVSIEINNLPDKLTYTVDTDELDLTGGKIKLNYNNDTNEIIDITPNMISGFDNTVLGNQTLIVTYGGKTATFQIEIVNGYSEGDLYGGWEIIADGTGVFKVDTESVDIEDIVVLDKDGNEVKFDEANQGWTLVEGQEYTVMFRYNGVEITNPEFDLKPEKQNLFPDTHSEAWYAEAVAYAYGRGILKGYQNGNFGPSDGIQRQDFLVMLARFDGVDLTQYGYDCNMPDVARDSYYESAVNWGVQNGITTGYMNGKFGVGDMITREQIVTFLYRYAKYKNIDVENVTDTKAKAFPDYNKVTDFAEAPIIWAIDKGVINGKSGYIAPQGNAQRCEIAQIMYNIFLKNIF